MLDKAAIGCHSDDVLDDRFEKLKNGLRSYGSCLVAYSGGVDSVFLARVAHEVLGLRALAVIADSPSLPRRELRQAMQIAEQFAFPVRVIKTAEFQNPNYVANPQNRCYFCKHELFEGLEPLAKAEGFAVICYGENASDLGDFRPGAQAAKEFQVRAPLKEAGLTKVDIRELSARMGLPTADKPQMACLSSRIPYGEAVTPQKLQMIEEAEYVLRDLGFYDVRVRHHEIESKATGLKTNGDQTSTIPSNVFLARIEVGPSEVARLLAGEVPLRVTAVLKAIGYTHVTVDLQGYRRGSANETLSSKLRTGPG